MKINVDKQFLTNQRLPGRPGCLGDIDNNEIIREKRKENRKIND